MINTVMSPLAARSSGLFNKQAKDANETIALALNHKNQLQPAMVVALPSQEDMVRIQSQDETVVNNFYG